MRDSHEDHWLVKKASLEYLRISSSQSCAILHPIPLGHLTTSRDISSYHNHMRGGEQVLLLVSSGQKLGMLPNILQCIRNSLAPNINSIEIEKLSYIVRLLQCLMVMEVGEKMVFLIAVPPDIVPAIALVQLSSFWKSCNLRQNVLLMGIL